MDSIDYLPARRTLYVAAGAAAKPTVAHVDEKGVLQRNAVATDERVAYVADGHEGKILVVRPAEPQPR